MKSIHGICLAIVWLCRLPTALSQPENCTKAKLNKAIYLVQTLQSESIPLIEALAVCPSISVREQAVFWGAFYYALTKQESKTVGLIESAFPYKAAKTSQQHIYYQARRGQWRPLKSKIESGDPLYLDNLNARLILAHSLMYSHRFEDAMSTFEEYLKIKPDDDFIDAEYLFALIWAKKYELAQARVDRLKTFPLGTYLKKSADHGEDLLKALQGPVRDQETGQVLFGQIISSIEQLNFSKGSERRSLGLHYQDKISGGIQLHQIESHLDKQSYDAVSFSGKGELGGEYGNIRGSLSYLSANDGVIMGFLGASLKLGYWNFSASISQDALTLLHPLPEAIADLTRQTLTTSIGNSDWLSYKLQLARDDGLSPFERHQLSFAIPVFYRSESHLLALIVPLEFRSQPKASPYYRSHPRDGSILAGVRYRAPIDSMSQASASVALGVRYKSSYQEEASYQTLVASDIELALERRLSKRWQVLGKLSFDNTSQEEFATRAENLLAISIGLAYGVQEANAP
ncbi:hypothetical protein [Pseudobacteriovorax antillogorgiicola]|uniref:Uncharacterized protein n=1 Tax=Pseudobacteriovorax antillogorgiicola TaxID=1513793 RepID=A0A1Y6BNP2_9BACT|nr:hypothetical protein [Pseudobacteriovorax antillogorgiicola]TCS55388.1 hypothetical protein EDD56_105109 [Pseudobacteriovorax antillogorgiicola]SMF13159.1 hypothetical protein SAMN06296036_105215 [Pseudobacteriovorax antillogorgiicola]